MSVKWSAILENTCSHLYEFPFSVKFHNERYFVPQLSEEIVAQNLISQFTFYFHVFNGCRPATSFRYSERSKNQTQKHEEVLQFCVRFASILQCPIKWNSGPQLQTSALRHQPLLMITCFGIAHIILLYIPCETIHRYFRWIANHAKYLARICLAHLGRCTRFLGTIFHLVIAL